MNNQITELDKFYDIFGKEFSGNVLAFIKLNDKNVILYKEKNNDDLLASFCNIGEEKNSFSLDPIIDKNDWNLLERIISLY